ncbi:MAG TPA: 7TM diverse intracellular signaling domain-containing protein, partial [Puia sp.]
MLQKHFSVLEDRNGSLSATDILRHPDALVPIDSFQKGQSTSYYWLKTELHTSDAKTDPGRVLSFTALTYVDIYLYQGDSLLIHKQAGAFRNRSAIDESDGRLYAYLPLQPSQNYTLLLQVHHTKHYQPVFDFSLQPKRVYFRKLRIREALDAALQGAVGIFFLYTLLSWGITRSRLYLWLLMFITGIGFYVIGSAGYFIEWFFPEDPAAGWLFNILFLDLGMLGLYLLITDFWRIKTDFPALYRWMRWIPAFLAISSIATFIIDYTTGNYNLTNNLHLASNPLMLTTSIAAVVTCWHRLSHPQRYLAYGILIIAMTGFFITLTSFFLHEKSLTIAPIVGDVAILSIFLLFSTGLKEKMRQHEVDKQAALKELNQLQQNQNIILEKKVEDRTEELRISNKRLLKQKHLLAERNTKIETLINELNHRVKNNLQLLYSLLSLQLPLV